MAEPKYAARFCADLADLRPITKRSPNNPGADQKVSFIPHKQNLMETERRAL
jgi:hypothetical protein